MSANPGGAEEGAVALDFSKLAELARGAAVLPVAVQDAATREVLMIAYANLQAVEESLRLRRAVFWSTSRGCLWLKGETSGDILDLEEIRVNCYNNSLLYLVRLRASGSCHTKDPSGQPRYGCFYRRLDDELKASMLRSPPYSGR